MNRQPVTSSRVISIGWKDNILEVEFNNGSVYQYTPIIRDRYEALRDSPQIGRDIQTIVNDKTLICVKM